MLNSLSVARLRCWPYRFSVLFLIASLLLGASHAQTAVISEFLAANNENLFDSDSEASDWIELYNPTDLPVRLEGWSLTDEAGASRKWIFPNVTLPGRTFLVVFASGKNRTNNLAELHANFSLSRDGEYLALVKPDGTIASEFTPIQQVTDVSYGISMEVLRQSFVPERAAGKFFVPTSALASSVWTQPDYDDAAWQNVTLGLGYDRIPVGATDPNEPPLALEDVTVPGDPVIPTSGNSPSNETAPLAIDNTTQTKYLNFDKLNSGFTVTPSRGASIVTGLRISSANDAPDRDPASFLLSGSNDGQTFTTIAQGPIPLYTARFQPQTVTFANTISYLHYKLIFPTVRNEGGANSMQISEVEFLGTVGSSAPSLRERIVTNVESSLYGKQSSAFLRLPFTLDALPAVENLNLHLWYEDGAVVWLNGVEIARVNAPATLSFNSSAVTNRFRRDANQERVINLNSRADLLRVGKNVLAIHGLNSAANSDEFLLDARLENTRLSLANRAYFALPTPGRPNSAPLGGLVSTVLSSQARGIQQAPFHLTLSSATPDAIIKYTVDFSVPNETNGIVYSGPMYIDKSYVVRAVALREGWRASPVETFSFVFLKDVVRQTRANALQAGFPASWNGQTADYGLDPRVVGPNDSYGGKYARTLQDNLKSIPSMSLVMDMADMFGPNGIYANPNSRGEAWERPVSFEIFYPDGRPGGQWNAGVRIQGGAFRRFDLSLKKSFRVVFREEYGPSRLNFPLFGPGAATEFQNIVLRANSNDAWPWGGGNALYIRDAFAMESIREMGQVSSHIEYVHLYINGQYWGLYNPVERPDAAFSSTYFGGDRDTWDALNQDSAPDGNYDAWNRLLQVLNGDITRNDVYQRAQGNNPDGTRNPAYEDLIDVENYINYLIMNFYVGNSDWPHRNWWAGRDRNNGDGFKFYPWDTETALGLSGVNQNSTGVTDGAARPYVRLRQNAEFRLKFADHVHKHFFNGGVFYVNSNSPAWNPAAPQNNRPAARFVALADRVRSPIVGESARWGDQLRASPYTRDENWEPTLQGLLNDYFRRRSSIVLEQFRGAGLYPRTVAPIMNQHGGKTSKGFQLTLTAPTGQIYYTINGGDPRATNSATRYTGAITLNDYAHVQARVWSGAEWSALEEATFQVGTPRLVVTELNYHPSDPTAAETAAGVLDDNDFEFIELSNAGDATMDLSDIRFDAGIAFDFANSSIQRLAPGQHILLVSNPTAMIVRYGAGLPIAGAFTGRLDNSGERLRAVNGAGETVLELLYRISQPWPILPNGHGPTLELVNLAGDLNDPASWQASATTGGSPGRATTVAVMIREPSLVAGELTFNFNARPGAAFTVTATDSLTTPSWQTVGQGTVPATGRVEQKIPTTTQSRYLRVRVE